VLVVEDEPTVRGLMVRVLSELGYAVLEAANGEEALHVAQAGGEEIHLLLADVVMPQLDGKALAGRLRAIYPHLAVLHVSGYAGSQIAQRGILEDGIYFLPKPFTITMLARKVREVLDRGEAGTRKRETGD